MNELNRERYQRKCPFCGEICEGTPLVNLLCKCGAKYYYGSDIWLDRLFIKEHTEVVERSETAQGCKESVNNGFSLSVTELQRENERLKAENAKYKAENHAQFDKWLKLEEATKRHHSELFEEAKVAVKEETVRKMQERLKAECNKYLLHSGITLMLHQHIDKIAKEVLEGEK